MKSCKKLIVLLMLFLPAVCTVEQYGGYAYAGYMYNKASTTPFTTGLSARIYTINPVVKDSHLAEWISVVWLPPSGEVYWIQLGYYENPSIGRRYYYEWKDQNGYSGPQFLGGGPEPSTTHLYFVQKTTITSTTWYYYIDYYLISSKALSLPQPYPSELEAMAEVNYITFPPKTSITGTHFSDLRYGYYGSWPLWDYHVVKQDYPYHVYEISNYEFSAWGP
ncbi:MAG: hypothetical protein ACP5KE_07900 [Candidatus Methanodesulfokora sp.]